MAVFFRNPMEVKAGVLATPPPKRPERFDHRDGLNTPAPRVLS